MPRYLKIGEILIKQGLITKEQLEKAIVVQEEENLRVGEALVKLGIISEENLIEALGRQLSIPYASKSSGLLTPAADQDLHELVSRDFAQRNLVIPLSRNLNSLTCAVFDPLDLILIDNLKKMTGCEINLVIATKTDILRAIEEFYGTKGSLLGEAVKDSYYIESGIEERKKDEEELSLDKLIAKAEEAPVVKLVDLIIRQAIDERASDIHIEPFPDKISLRYRIDGALYEIPPPARHLHLPIISRIKILAKLDIAEKRLPQDGAFIVKLEDRVVDLRISTIPTVNGEKIVIRILDRSSAPLDLVKLGYEAKQLENFKRAIYSPYGLVFLTGPTGCGKTTTLYASLREIMDPRKNIITIEEPVEYKINGINQVQVKPEIGLTFASSLRSFLRQDPDIILVGEVRDLETAQICVRAALTGHLVLSSLHTNDAPSAVTRLMDIGIEPYLLMPSLICVAAQRLIRKLCPKCKEAYEPKASELGGVKLSSNHPIYKAKGCDECNQIGYRGRLAVYEVMMVNDEIRALIHSKADYAKIREVAKKTGMETIFDNGIKKVEAGVTSLEEIFSVTLGEI
ncbi:MAG: type II secretion system protein GspE [Candidatus Omnitrophica bacterium]|nr:type II secretion system protein GspE [Candidatus Omnitrophota bacterium]